MVRRWRVGGIGSLVIFLLGTAVSAQQTGSIRGVVYDRDFDAPLPLVQVSIVEIGDRVNTDEEGHYVFHDIQPGRYTVMFAKEGYTRFLRTDVIVTAGQVTDIDASMAGEFAEMEEFIVRDLQIGAGTEAGLLRLRMDSPSLLDSISADLMSRAGAGDAATALNLVSGATVQDGRFAVIRGLPDRYVSSQLNGVRLPTADEDKRAVELDQFPSAVIESIRVSKTFTPDQQGDASGGAVNVILKGIPEQTVLQLQGQYSFNTQISGRNDFLTYKGGGLTFWGIDDSRDIPSDGDFDSTVGVSRGRAPIDYKWSLAAGGKHELDSGVTIGGLFSFFYERDSSFYNNGIDDSLWVVNPGDPMTPQTSQGTPEDGDFKTSLFDVTQGVQSVRWGGLATAGIATDNHSLNATYLYTRTAENRATLAEDTRGKEHFFPGYDPNDPTGPGNAPSELSAAPYIRTETLAYTERTTETLMFGGQHTLPFGELRFGDVMRFQEPEFDWTVALSAAGLNQPDKRQFGSLWHPESFNPGAPPFLPPFFSPATYFPYKPAANFTLGNVQRIWKAIQEESTQYALNLRLPFTQWNERDGYLKFGIFDDSVERHFDQETFSNFNDNQSFQGDWTELWSGSFPLDEHPFSAGRPFVDVDYRGEQKISAWYGMADLPVTSFLSLIGGARVESTDLSIKNFPEQDATWFPPGSLTPVALNPGDADVQFSQTDVLPSIGFVLTPLEHVTLRGAYSQTLARQTFKELTPIMQQEFLGGPVFIGNPELEMSSLRNFDLRLDYTPYEGSLFSVSWFHKDVTDPIEYVQRVASGFTYTTPVNYPKGQLTGWEFEVRQQLGRFWSPLEGLAIGGNATLIDSEVRLPASEVAAFSSPAIMAPMSKRHMTNAPEYLYNIYLTYDLEPTGTQFAIFYTVKGDTLVAGAGQADGNFVPSVFAKEYGTLNLTISQRLGEHLKLRFQAKNLTDPAIEEVYRSKHIGGDVLKSSFKKGIDFSIGLSAEFTF